MNSPFGISRRSLLMLAAAACTSCRRTPTAPQLIQVGGFTMGGSWSVKLPRLPQRMKIRQLHRRVQSLLSRLDAEMSLYRDDSVVCRFNRSRSTEWFAVSGELASTVSRSLDVSKQTGGAFDITVAPLVLLWGFGPPQAGRATTEPPPAAALARAKQTVGYAHLQVRPDPPAIRKDLPEVCIDLGAIGKGAAADAVAALLDDCGATDYLIDVGGELKARGLSHLARPWRIGIETPAPDTHRVLLEIELLNSAIATSGDYRNFRQLDGRRICHEIDPRTGTPAADPPASVSVLHASAATADALATAMMVLGPDAAVALADRLNLPALVIHRGQAQFQMLPSRAFKPLLGGRSSERIVLLLRQSSGCSVPDSQGGYGQQRFL